MIAAVLTFFRVNTWARWLGGAVVFLVGWNVWLAQRDRSIRKEAERDIVQDINQQTEERIDDATQAGRTTADLNARELRRLAANSPDNRGGLPRAGAD